VKYDTIELKYSILGVTNTEKSYPSAALKINGDEIQCFINDQVLVKTLKKEGEHFLFNHSYENPASDGFLGVIVFHGNGYIRWLIPQPVKDNEGLNEVEADENGIIRYKKYHFNKEQYTSALLDGFKQLEELRQSLR